MSRPPRTRRLTPHNKAAPTRRALMIGRLPELPRFEPRPSDLSLMGKRTMTGAVETWGRAYLGDGFEPRSKSRDEAGGKRPYERRVIGCATTTPPGPPLARGEKEKGAFAEAAHYAESRFGWRWCRRSRPERVSCRFPPS